MKNQARYGSNNINIFDLEINSGIMRCRVFWARIISSENESLFTTKTKHTFYEIQYALEGRIGMLIGGERVTFDESDFIVIPPDTYHQIVDGDTEGERFIMAFTLESEDEGVLESVRKLHSLLPHRETERMRQLLSLMFHKDYSGSPLRKRQLATLIECLLAEILEAVSPRETASTVSDHGKIAAKRTVDEIVDFIHSRGGIGITVAELAQSFNLSQRHLGRLFVSATGESPKEAINHEKLKRIEALVSTTSLSLGEISELCGFSDEYAMNKFFRRYTMTNLSDFRAISKERIITKA